MSRVVSHSGELYTALEACIPPSRLVLQSRALLSRIRDSVTSRRIRLGNLAARICVSGLAFDIVLQLLQGCDYLLSIIQLWREVVPRKERF
jgi:hypothetical protein